MTLLLTVFAAVITTAIWYKKSDEKMLLGPLCWMFWGASLMWLVDAIFEYAELKAAYFTPAPRISPCSRAYRSASSSCVCSRNLRNAAS